MSARAWQARRSKFRPMLVTRSDPDKPWTGAVFTFPSRWDLAAERRLASSRRRVHRRRVRRHEFDAIPGLEWTSYGTMTPPTAEEAMRLLGVASRTAAERMQALADAWFPMPDGTLRPVEATDSL